MTVPTIFETCRPRQDILTGAITESDFAADLALVVGGRAGSDYPDPVCFFADTYPTRGLKNLLANVCRRLPGAGGEVAAIFRLDTSHGGGKTHGLIALAHAANGLKGVPKLAEFVEPFLIPSGNVRVAASMARTPTRPTDDRWATEYWSIPHGVRSPMPSRGRAALDESV